MFGIKKKTSVTVSDAGTAMDISNSDGIPVSLQKKVDAARISLAKEVPFTLKMAVMAFVDASGSMSGFYANGTVQELTERALGFAIAMDDDGQIPVYGFESRHFSAGTVNASNYQGFVSRSGLGPLGTTNLSASLDFLEKAAKKTKEPIYALIVTDGAPDDRRDVTQRLKRISMLPVFVKILVVGYNRDAWKYVEDVLDDNDWPVDNVDGQQMNEPAKLSDQQFADKMTEELHSWYRSASNAGIIK